MKSNERVQKITVNDISKINEALASKDLPKILLNGNAEIALITQRIIKKRLRKDPDGFSSRELTTLYGVANDKVQNALKKKKVTKKEGNGVVQEEKRVSALEMKEMLKEVRAKQRKVQEQGARELEERRKREQEEKREREQEERWSAPDPYRL